MKCLYNRGRILAPAVLEVGFALNRDLQLDPSKQTDSPAPNSEPVIWKAILFFCFSRKVHRTLFCWKNKLFQLSNDLCVKFAYSYNYNFGFKLLIKFLSYYYILVQSFRVYWFIQYWRLQFNYRCQIVCQRINNLLLPKSCKYNVKPSKTLTVMQLNLPCTLLIIPSRLTPC